MSRALRIICDNCSGAPPALVQCGDCNRWMCQRCRRAHTCNGVVPDEYSDLKLLMSPESARYVVGTCFFGGCFVILFYIACGLGH